MTRSNERIDNEILHGKRLASNNPEAIWQWASPAGQIRAGRRARLLIQAAGLKPDMKVMEIGCGTGLFTELMAETGAHILAIDVSPDLLEIARQRKLPSDLVEFREMRFEEAPVEEPYDAILGSSVLHHLDMFPALKHMFQLLKPGGSIAFAEPNMLNPQVWLERNIPYIRKKLNVSPDETALVRWRMAQDLAKIGFADIQIRNVDWLHPAIPRFLISIVYKTGLLLERVPVIKEFSGSVLIQARRPISK